MQSPTGSSAKGSLRVLHTNDLHGRLLPPLMPALLAAREECDLYFDTGDAILTGNLGIPLGEEPVWQRLAEARCTASVPGNRESHVVQKFFLAKLAGAQHPLVCANLYHRGAAPDYSAVHVREGKLVLPSHPLPLGLVLSVADLTVGLVAAMVPMVTPRMKTQALSAYHWDQPLPVLAQVGEWLRPQVDLLFALTHIGLRQDEALAGQTTVFDGIFGGHSHTVLSEPLVVNGTPILQGGSHGRFLGLSEWVPGSGLTRHELRSWAS